MGSGRDSFNNYADEISDITKDYVSDKGYRTITDNTESFGVYISQLFFSRVENNKLSQDDINGVILDINCIVKSLVGLKTRINSDSNLDSLFKMLLTSRINRNIQLFIMYRYGVYIEATKAGFYINDFLLTHAQKIVDKMQSLLYGPKISDVDDEKKQVILTINNLYNKNKLKLSTEERDYFESIFVSKHSSELLQNEVDFVENEIDFQKREISSDRVLEVFRLCLSFYGISLKPEDPEGWSVEYSQTKDNVIVVYSKKTIYLPAGCNSYSIRDLCRLIDHEISVHAIRGYNTFKTTQKHIGNHSELEEGLAVYSDRIITQESLYEPGIGHISTFIGENYGYQDSFRLLEIYFKLEGHSSQKSKLMAKNRLKRIKKFHLDSPGADRKNVVYHRGLKFFVDYFANISYEKYKKFIEDFYFSKLGLEEFEYIDDLKELLGVDQSELLKPSWIGRILSEKFFNPQKGSLKGLEQRDFRFKAVDGLTMTQKRKLIQILDIFRAPDGVNNIGQK